jgi:hypothetical protein
MHVRMYKHYGLLVVVAGVMVASVVFACDPSTPLVSFADTNTLAFVKNKFTCDATHELQCSSRCGFEKRLSPIVCTNMNFRTETTHPVWKCTSTYTLTEGLSLSGLHVVCNTTADGLKYQSGSCALQYKVWTPSDDDSVWYSLLKAFGWAIAYLLAFMFMLAFGRPQIFVVFGSFGGHRSGGGGSSAFAT